MMNIAYYFYASYKYYKKKKECFCKVAAKI